MTSLAQVVTAVLGTVGALLLAALAVALARRIRAARRAGSYRAPLPARHRPSPMLTRIVAERAPVRHPAH